MKRLPLFSRFASRLSLAALTAGLAVGTASAANYDLASRDVLRTVVVNTNGLSSTALAGWIAENAANEFPQAGASVTSGSASGYRLTGFRAGRGLTRVRAEYALGDRLIAPADLGEIDWYETYRQSAASNKENTFLFTGTGDYSDAVIYFACGGNPVIVNWVEKNGTCTTRTYVVSDTASSRPYRLYRTDAPYNGNPISLEGQYVKIIGDTSLFTLQFDDSEAIDQGGHTVTNENVVTRGVYLTSDNMLYCVGDVKGQFLLVYYNSGDFTDVRTVQVIEACTPTVKSASAVVGQQLKPTADGYEIAGLYPSVVTSSRTTYDGRGDFIYVHEGEASYSPHRNAAFAIRPTKDEDDAQDRPWDATINWYAPDEMGVQWPFEQTQYSISWGDGVRLLVSDDASEPGQAPVFPDDWTVTACDYQSPNGHLTGELAWKGPGKSLLKVEGTDADGLTDVAFIPVEAVVFTNIAGIVSSRDVGVAVTPSDPAAVCVTNAGGCTYLGYIHKPVSITCYDPDCYIEPSSDLVDGYPLTTGEVQESDDEDASILDAASQTLRSDIFFVNVPEGSAEKTLDVWWNIGVTAGNLAEAAYFPSLRERVRATFPSEETTEQIVLASMKGSSGVSILTRVVTNGSVVAKETYWHTNVIIMSSSTPHVYTGGADATDGTGIGWNPNVTHAWCDAGDSGYVCWALRNDMVTHSTLKNRHPLVYVKGKEYDELGFERPRVWTYYVLSTNEAYPEFAADMLVGDQLPGPHPLDLARDPWLPEIYWTDKIDKSQIVAYRDRKGVVWARRDGTLEIFMYYANLNEYKFTSFKNGVPVQWKASVPSGTPLPWNCVLDENCGARQTMAPGAWTWTAKWPSGSPAMQIGRTITKATDGLAEVWGAASAAVVWPDPTGIDVDTPASRNDVAQLVDPTKNQTASLASIGVSRDSLLKTLDFSADPGGNLIYRDGIYYFANVPASLSRRVWYDPNADISQCLVVQGKLDEKTGGVSILYMNVLNATERQALKDLVPDTNNYRPAWDAVIDSLATTPVRPNSHSYVISTSQSGKTFTEFKTTYSPIDHYALASLGGGGKAGATNWVVWIENDAAPDSGLGVEEGDAISMHVQCVVPEFYLGSSVTRTDENNLLSQLLDVLYTEPFGGSPDAYVFEWQSAEPKANGTAPSEDDWRDSGHSGIGVTRFTLGSQGTLADLVNTYYRVRYRANAGSVASETMGTKWSDWTEPCLAEGWIQRVINSITPFTQRVTDLYENPPETTISMISQIGGPYQGDVALNMDNMTEVGLLETYMTLLNKAESMSIAMGDDASIDKTSVNKQLLQLVERMDDFYALLGNEAYSDAANPTIAYGSGEDYGQICSGLFAFDNQVPTLLDEELALLRGRGVIEDETEGDDVTAYQQAPVYNRLLWNYTRGENEGEVAYALNYNTTPGEDEIDIQAETAAAEYPQGHGDAWGHYLDGLKLWYRLLRNPSFSWSVSMGEMNVDDHAINVDYYEEEKMAEAAASLGKAAERIVDLTARKVWRDRDGALSAADAGYEDSVSSRAFGYGEWGNKGGVATFVNWMVVNSLLPAADTNETDYTDQGLLKINRSTVGELADLANRYALIQRKVDRLNDNYNPLGLSDDAVPFGLSTAAADGSESHFEQTLALAKNALKNADALLEKAGESTARLRAIQNAAQDADDEAAEEEESYKLKLISYYGYPYAGDIGVGKTYEQDYDGPDIYHWSYVENAPSSNERSFSVAYDTSRSDNDGNPITLSFDYSRLGIVIKPGDVTGTRRACGSLQTAYQDYISAVNTFDAACAAYTALEKMAETMQDELNKLEAYEWTTYAVSLASSIISGVSSMKATVYEQTMMKDAALATTWLSAALSSSLDVSGNVRSSKVNDATYTISQTKIDTAKKLSDRSSWNATYEKTKTDLESTAKSVKKWSTISKIVGFGSMAYSLAWSIVYDVDNYNATLDSYYQQLNEKGQAVLTAFNAIGPAGEKVLTLKAEAEALQDALEAARQKRARAAAKSRYQDMAHRLWRDEALDVYASAFDLAQRYTYLAAKAYDYETGGEITAGTGTSDFLDAIVGTRLPGELTADGDTMRWGGTGDAGLSDILKQLEENWADQEKNLGINNPQDEMTWFSLRTEAFRILPGSDGLNAWRNKLDTFRVSNLRDYAPCARLCKDLSSDELDEPALIIPLSTTIEFGKNFFGQDLAGGDHQFTTTHYATKIAEAGVTFVNYNLDKDGATTEVFAAEPYVYLIPAGSDRMRSPATGEIVEFNVVDQLLEVPNILGSKALAQSWSAIYEELSAQSGTASVRKYPAFRANGESNSTTLIGRSVWNTQWVLVIPAGSLRSDRSKALEEFVWGNEDTAGITDIKIGFRTYSHWGK